MVSNQMLTSSISNEPQLAVQGKEREKRKRKYISLKLSTKYINILNIVTNADAERHSNSKNI